MIPTSGHARFGTFVLGWLAAVLSAPAIAGEADRSLVVSWDNEILTIRGKHLPGGALEVWYIEAFCRPGSTRRDWKQTVIPHQTHVVAAGSDGRWIKLRSELTDGVLVDHEIRAGRDVVDFRVVATNPTSALSQAHWAQPCVRVDRYAGTKAEHGSEAYLPRCFIYTRGKRSRLPTEPWARNALYTPGQVWCPEGVSHEDVNPRPLSEIVPSNGLIGCVSADGKELVAMAWEPYQELFQGVIVCLHSDFRIGGLNPGQSKTIRGKIYLMPADFPKLEARYRQDFPTQERRQAAVPASTDPHAKKLIEFGWDEPDTSFLRRHHAQLKQTPFDGCVFHVLTENSHGAKENLTWLAWGRRRFTRAETRRATDDLRLPHRLEVPSSFPAVQRYTRRPRLVRRPCCDSRATRGWPPRCRAWGVARGSCSTPSNIKESCSTLAAQRDRSRHSWEDYAAQAQKRGREVMMRLSERFPRPDCSFDVRTQLSMEREPGRQETAGGLYLWPACPLPRWAGRGRAGKTKLVDGHELSYGYRDASAFIAARDVIGQHAATLAADRKQYRNVVSAGFGLWLDYDWRKRGWNTDQLEQNYFSPERLEVSLRAAVEQSDEYVWIYTEKPHWWSERDGAVDLPGAYVETLSRVRRALLDE